MGPPGENSAGGKVDVYRGTRGEAEERKLCNDYILSDFIMRWKVELAITDKGVKWKWAENYLGCG